MKKPFYILFFLLLFLTFACSLPINKSDDSDNIEVPSVNSIQPTEAVVVNPTQTFYSPPTARPTSDGTQTPSPTVEEKIPTETPTVTPSLCSPFVMEEFENPGECWPDSIDEVVAPASISNKNKVVVQIKDGRLEFESQLSEDVFLYSFYKDNEYDEVIVRASVTKIEPSVNQNGFTLVCHANRDGWYEARLESSGTFEVFQYDINKKQNGENPYVRLANGGTSNFKTSAGIENIIEWQCRYDSLTLIVNGKQIWEKLNFSKLKSGGGVGVGLASYSGIYPRHIGFEYVEILEP